MRQKLFTKQIDEMLFKQYPLGNDLLNQKVVAKIFNPYGRGTWYLLNSDPNDPDYIWAIVDLFEVEVGSVSRQDLESIKVPPFGLNLERDMYFQPINARELLNRLRQGEKFADGGLLENANELIGKYINVFSIGVKEPITEKIVSVTVTPIKYAQRFLNITTQGGGVERIPIKLAEDFLKFNLIELRNSKGEPYAIELDKNSDNTKVIRTQFEEEEYEYEGGGIVSKENGNTRVDAGNFTFYFDGVEDTSKLIEIYHKPTDLNCEFDTRYSYSFDSLKNSPSNRLMLIFKHPTMGDFMLYSDFVIKKERPVYVDGSNYADGGMMKRGGNISVDLFEYYDEQPPKLRKITNKWAKKYEEEEMDYEDTKKFLKEVEAIGYTFDFDLDNMPYGLRPIGTKISEEYADGGIFGSNKNLSRDRMFKSEQGWEKYYKRKSSPKNPRYKKEDGGMMGVSGEVDGEWVANTGAGMFGRGGYISGEEYRDRLEEMDDEELLSAYCDEYGLDVEDEDNKERIEDERDSIIDEMVNDYVQNMKRTGRFYAKGGQTSMKKDKSFYQELPEYKGYKWRGFWDRFHHFVKKEGNGYYEIRVTDKDIENGNYKDMIDYGYSYAKGGATDVEIVKSKEGEAYLTASDSKKGMAVKLADGGMMAKGGGVGEKKYFYRYDSINSRGGINHNTIELEELPKILFVNQNNYAYTKKKTVNGNEYIPIRIVGGFMGVKLSDEEIKEKKIKRIETLQFDEGGGMMAKGGKTQKEFKVGDKVIYAPNGKFFGAKNTYYGKDGEIVEIIGEGKETRYKIEIKNKFGVLLNTHIALPKEIESIMAKGGMMARGGEISVGSEIVGGKKLYFIYNSESGKKSEYFDNKEKAEKELANLLQTKYALSLSKRIMANGGMTKKKTTFKEKVKSIKASLLKRKKVSPKVQKDYGKTYSPAEAEESAKRIAGAMRKKEYYKKKS